MKNPRLVLIADKTTSSLLRSMVQRKHPVDVGGRNQHEVVPMPLKRLKKIQSWPAKSGLDAVSQNYDF